jgi:hypothetical protein
MSDHSNIVKTQKVVGCSFSIALYALLSITSFSLYDGVRRRKARQGSDEYYNFSPVSKYDDVRLLFFRILGFSALMDIPLYAACLGRDMSDSSICVWNTFGFRIVWTLHLIALCGYFLCLGIPLVLWSSILKGSDVNLLVRPLFALNRSSNYLYATFFTYVVLICVEVGFVFNGDAINEDPSSRMKGARCAESVFYSFVACAWLVYGIRLRYHIPILQDRDNDLRQLLRVTNVLMLVVCISYVARAGFIMFLMVSRKEKFRNNNFLLWIAATRWMPYIVCPGLLMAIMNFTSRTKSYDINLKYSPVNCSDQSASSENNPPEIAVEGLLNHQFLENQNAYRQC